MTTTTTVNETALDSRQVSLLQNHVSTTPDNTNTIYDCLESIQSKDFADLLQPVRSAVNDATQYKAAKSKLPAFMFNGVFQDGRGLSDLAHYNNLIVLDIDHIDNPDGIKNLLKVEPWIKAIFVSPSLKGLKIIVPFANNALVNDCNADLAGDNKQAAQTKLKEYHYNQFCDLESYFAKTYNLTLDKSGKDIPRLCYISYDANIYVNPDCVARPIVEPVPVVMVVDTNTNNNTATAYSEPKPVTTATNKRTKKAGTANEVPKCETWTVKQAAWHLQIVKADDYLTWRNVGFALSNHYNRSEEAFAAFVQWSKTSCKFISDIDCRFKIWDATNEATSKAITIATIAHYHNDACNDYYENIHLDLAARKHELYSSFVAKADTSYLTLLRDGYKTRGKAELKEDINHYLFSKGISPRSNEVETIIRNLYKVNGVFPTVSCLGAGIHSFNDEMYLVERTPRFIKPVKGEWSNLQYMLETTMPTKDREWLYSRLALDIKGFLDQNSKSKGQLLMFIGGVGTAKTTMQDLIKDLYAGTSAPVAKIISGKEKFDSEMIKYPYWIVDDTFQVPAGNTIHSFKQSLIDFIKTATVASPIVFRGMYKDGVTVHQLFRRAVFTLNDTNDLLKYLPDGSDIDDKYSLLAFNHRFAKTGFDEAILKKELPHFAYYLLNEWIQPAWIESDARFGIAAYKNEELQTKIFYASPDAQVLGEIESILKFTNDEYIDGTANDIFDKLKTLVATNHLDNSLRNGRFVRLQKSNFGLTLRALKKQCPDIVNNDLAQLNGCSQWRIGKKTFFDV